MASQPDTRDAFCGASPRESVQNAVATAPSENPRTDRSPVAARQRPPQPLQTDEPAPGPAVQNRRGTTGYWQSIPDPFTDPDVFRNLGLGTVSQDGGGDIYGAVYTLVTEVYVEEKHRPPAPAQSQPQTTNGDASRHPSSSSTSGAAPIAAGPSTSR